MVCQAARGILLNYSGRDDIDEPQIDLLGRHTHTSHSARLPARSVPIGRWVFLASKPVSRHLRSLIEAG